MRPKKYNNEVDSVRLVKHNKKGNLLKSWYVEYRAFNTDTNELERKRCSSGINIHDNLKDKEKAAEEVFNEIKGLLKEGYTLGGNKLEKLALGELKIIPALDYVIKIKEKEITDAHLYKVLKNKVKEFIDVKKLKNLKIKHFNVFVVEDFKEFLLEQCKSPKTINVYINTLSGVFTVLRRKDKTFTLTPTKDVRRLKITKSKKHMPYTPEQRKLVKEKLMENGESQLLNFVQFVFLSLARPNEIRKMQIGHIRGNQIFIPVENAKNDVNDSVSIPPPLRKVIESMNLQGLPSDYFIFSKKGQPGAKPMSKQYFSKKFKPYIKQLNFDASGMQYTLYGFKHSGAIQMRLDGVDLWDIKTQCRHRTVSQTEVYLRELGAFRKEDTFDKVRPF